MFININKSLSYRYTEQQENRLKRERQRNARSNISKNISDENTKRHVSTYIQIRQISV